MATLGWNAILVVLFNRLIDLTGGPNGLLGVKPFSFGGFRLDTDPRGFRWSGWCRCWSCWRS